MQRPKYLKNEEGEMEWMWWYFVNKKVVGETSFFPQPPYDSDDDNDNDNGKLLAIDLTGDGVGKGGMKPISEFFHCPLSNKSYCQEVQVDEEEEDDEDDKMEESGDEEPTVLDLVLSGDRPVFLRMDKKEDK